MNISVARLPEDSILLQQTYLNHYQDSFQGDINADHYVTIEETAKAFFAWQPSWVKLLMNIRDSIVKVFGLKISRNSHFRTTASYNPGENFGPFKILDKSKKEMILGQDDKHLDFRLSLYIQQCTPQKLLCTTVVKYNNMWGRIYFFFVKPFHRLIVPAMLKSTLHHLDKVPLTARKI